MWRKSVRKHIYWRVCQNRGEFGCPKDVQAHASVVKIVAKPTKASIVNVMTNEVESAQ